APRRTAPDSVHAFGWTGAHTNAWSVAVLSVSNRRSRVTCRSGGYLAATGPPGSAGCAGRRRGCRCCGWRRGICGCPAIGRVGGARPRPGGRGRGDRRGRWHLDLAEEVDPRARLTHAERLAGEQERPA